jgi:transaldolase
LTRPRRLWSLIGWRGERVAPVPTGGGADVTDEAHMPKLSGLKIKLFTDGADKAQIMEMAKQPWIRGFTTNPSLLKKAGVSDYETYARDLVAAVPDRHISFEVFSDDIPEMVAQARKIASWAATSTSSCR